MAAAPVPSLAVFVIAGMHRSGTSLVARVLNLLGLDLGDPSHLMEAKPDNPTGFWESVPIASFNDGLLAELGGSWDNPVVPDGGWELDSRFDPWVEGAAELVRAEFPAGGVVGWKDPRISLLLPFWRRVVQIAGEIVVVRDPREVAGSLAARDGIDADAAAGLWTRYSLMAMNDARSPVIVRYSAFFEDLDRTVDDLARRLGLATPDDDTRERIALFFDPSLRHHAADSGEVGPNMAVAMSLDRMLDDGLPGSLLDLLVDGLRMGRVGSELRHARARVMSLEAHVSDLIFERDTALRMRNDLDQAIDGLRTEMAVVQRQRSVEAEALGRQERVAERLRGRLGDTQVELNAVKKRLAAGVEGGRR